MLYLLASVLRSLLSTRYNRSDGFVIISYILILNVNMPKDKVMIGVWLLSASLQGNYAHLTWISGSFKSFTPHILPCSCVHIAYCLLTYLYATPGEHRILPTLSAIWTRLDPRKSNAEGFSAVACVTCPSQNVDLLNDDQSWIVTRFFCRIFNHL